MNFDFIEFDSSKPIYIQIINLIKKKIISNEIGVGEQLPSVREISGILKVNINTIQKVYKELEREGITVMKRGLGTFVTEDDEKIDHIKKEMADKITIDFLKDMKDMGYDFQDILKMIDKRK